MTGTSSISNHRAHFSRDALATSSCSTLDRSTVTRLPGRVVLAGPSSDGPALSSRGGVHSTGDDPPTPDNFPLCDEESPAYGRNPNFEDLR